MNRKSALRRRSVLGLLGTVPLAAGGAVAAGGVVARAESSHGGGTPHDLRPGGKLDREVAELAAADRFSGAFLVADHGRPGLARAYGMANQDRSTPNRLGTIFNLASVTKMFTGLAIAQLVAQGKLEFHDKLGTYLDGFPAAIAGTATVHQLLTHTSGVGRPPVGPGTPGSAEWDTVEEVWNGTLAIIRETPPRFPPGTSYAYSNDGFWVLGAIVKAITGQPFEEYVRRNIFGPAGMERTDYRTRTQVRTDPAIAHPYLTLPSGERVDHSADERFPFIGGPAGGAYSTVADLLGFATALWEGRLLADPYTGLVTSGKVARHPSDKPNDPGVSEHYASYGFSDLIVGGRRAFGHSGSGPGTSTNVDMFHDVGLTVVVLSNYDGAARPVVDLARRIIGENR